MGEPLGPDDIPEKHPLDYSDEVQEIRDRLAKAVQDYFVATQPNFSNHYVLAWTVGFAGTSTELEEQAASFFGTANPAEQDVVTSVGVSCKAFDNYRNR